MKTLSEVAAANPFPSWSRPISGDGPNELNVAGLRAKTAAVPALAPVRAYLRRPDGTLELIVLAGVEASPCELAVVVEWPADFVGG